MNSDIKIIALDLDGTLLHSNHQISDENKKVLNILNKKGIEIILCTGRPYDAMKHFREELNLDNPVICFNGAALIDSSEKYLISTNLNTEISKKLIEIGEESKIYYHGFMGNKWLIPFLGKEAQQYKERSGLKETIVDFNSIKNPLFVKMMYIGDNKILNKIYKKLDTTFGNHVYKAFSSNNFLEVLNPKSSKAKALDFYLKSKGMSSRNLLSIGDGYNDFEMLNFSEVGVVMENAPEEMKKKFKYTTLSNDKDGVAVFLKKFFSL